MFTGEAGLMAKLFWHNGQLKAGNSISLSLTEPGWLYGATVFTTLRVYNSCIDHPLTAWAAHCDRLQASLNALGWRSPDWAALRQGSEQLATSFPVLRLTLFPDGSELITGRSLPATLLRDQQQGVAVWVADGKHYQRCLPGHKTGNYLPCWLALQEAQRHGAQDAILVNPSSGAWLETSTGSLWGWVDGHWWTPPLRQTPTEEAAILPGITRSQVISWLRWQNERIGESLWMPDLIARFETIAYSNSIRQIIPIRSVFESVFEGALNSEKSPDDKQSPSPIESSQVRLISTFDTAHPALDQLREMFRSAEP